MPIFTIAEARVRLDDRWVAAELDFWLSIRDNGNRDEGGFSKRTLRVGGEVEEEEGR